MAERRRGHGVKPLKATRVPHSIVVATVSPVLEGDPTGYAERWRSAYLHFARSGGSRPPESLWRPAGHPSEMWTAVSGWCGWQGLTFLWGHDVARLARMSAMFVHLPHLGWELDAFSLNPGATWFVWRRARATLKVTDVQSVWPVDVQHVASLFGMSRKDTPAEGASYMTWDAFTRRDCEILSHAVHAYTEWVDAEDLGGMAITGNGQAWCAFRRRFMTDGILIHDNPDARADERRAMWTGRCEAYWRGSLGFQVVHEWDLTSAYTNIVAANDVPTLLHGPMDPGRPLRSYLDDGRYEILAEVEVDTQVPVVPTSVDAGIVWPVGRLVTTLWTPELRAASDWGDAVRVRRGWLYRRAHALGHWGAWVIGALDCDDSVVPAWQKAILKRWGNVLVGRFAMQYPKWTRVARSPDSDVRYTPVLDEDTGEEYAVMQVGHDVWRQVGTVEAHHSAPQITGWVMSKLRADLWQIMQQVPSEALLYVDTDSLLVTDRWIDAMQAIQESPLGRGLRLKRSWSGVSIYGPRQIVTGDSVRVAGLPKGAQRTGRHEFAGEVTEGLLAAIGGRRLDEVRIVPTQWRMEGTDTRRAGSGVGWTAPFIVDQVSPDP
jgi:hypothetical protein